MAIPFLGKKKVRDDSKPPARSKVIPSVSLLSQVRRVHEQALEGLFG